VAPQIITRPSVVPGKQQATHIRYNDRGQPLEVTHKGWRPATEAGQPPQAIERSTRYQYQLVNGRSVLSQVDGPLPNANNGPQGSPQSSPQDSDITRYTWDARGSYVVAMDAPQGQSQVTYDPAGRVASVSSERGTTHWTYNGQQLTQVEQSQLGWPTQKQTYAYDAHGRMTEQTGQTKRAYDPAGRLLWQASAMGVLETKQWDALGQLTQTKRLTNAITQENNYTYDEQGRITQLSDNQGRVTRIAYNGLGQPTWIADQSGRVISATTDEPVHAIRPQQWVDDFGRVVATRSPDHGLRTQQFDAANRLIAMRDALGNHSQYQYDARGRIARQTGASGTESITTEWRYEGDHLVELIHPTQSEQYTYDERGLRIRKTVIRSSGRNNTLTAITRYAYNEHGQLMGTSLPDGSWITYTRNGQGQVVAIKRSPIHPQHLRWLAWLLPEQTIAQDFERDMVGLRSYTQGNGLQTRYQRSQAGVLARVYVSKPVELKTQEEQAKAADKLLQLLGIQAAYAQNEAPNKTPNDSAETPRAATDKAAESLNTLGALGIKPDSQALIDHRYLWDTRGNLLYTRSGAKQTEVQAYAYDGVNRLLVSVQSEGKQDALKERAVNRYFYQGSKRVLQQQNAAVQSDLQTNTLRVSHREGTHQWTGSTQTDASFGADYDAAGQPNRLGQRRFKWDAYGRLVQVSRDAGQPIAHYTYNHRGERIHKSAGKEDTAYLYNDSRQLQAELNNKKHITRQYIYLADMPLAVIDTPEGVELDEARSDLWQTLHELMQVISAALTTQGDITYLHTNHLGAVEAATNIQGKVIWQVAYEPFGAARVQTSGASKAFALNLRLPGQYEDAETGLHYNDHRYYDPARGEYISPDPLGNPNGSNSYAYVGYNPLNAIDPLGLILFAFDGTGNDLSNAGSLTNVARFERLYLDGKTRYVAGVGTAHEDDKWGDISVPLGDAGHNGSGARRIERMMTYLMEEARAAEDKTPMAIDIVGFSRGAAQARDFANNIIQYSGVSVTGDIFNLRIDEGGWLHYNASVRNASGQMVRFEGRQCVQLRFMGLWDTVLSTNSGRDYRLGIPLPFAHVAHAVALNEYRADETAWNATRRNLDGFAHLGGFPLVSIGASTKTTNQVRIERGFIGAHADIGGGYPAGENQLSFVALSWMVSQARSAGVQIGTPDIGSAIPTANPLIHDQSNALRVGRPTGAQGGSRQFTVGGLFGSSTYMVEDRGVQGAVSGVRQRDMGFTSFGPNDRSMLNAETMNFISYLPRNLEGQRNNAETWETRGPQQVNSGTNQTGRVDIGGYMQWLRAHGYCFAGDACDRKAQK
jgi:RHS repeat-associated protein